MTGFQVMATLLALSMLGACSGKVQETRLANGLKIVVQEDHRSPVVVSQIWYKVGSVDEPAGLTGISHVLEHMMFKGTAKLKPNEFSRIVAEHGGRENAFTGRDYTAYFQQWEKSRLPLSFELEAERMQNLKLDPEELRKEVQVVLEERRLRTEDKPEGKVHEKFLATAFTVHPYGNPIIGSVRDLEALRVEDLERWYRQWYVPNNATLVVVGDVKPREVFDLAKKYFASIPAGKLTPPALPPEPPQKQTRRVEVAVPAQVPYISLGFHVPSLTADGNAEPYALDVLAGVLSGGESARLVRNLVRGQQIAAAADCDYSMVSRYPFLFTLDAVPSSGVTTAQLEAALWQEIERLKREPVAPAELERVKAQVVAQDVYARDSTFNQAMVIGMLETTGLDWRYMDKYVKRIQAVTAEQVRAVANKYLTQENMTVATLKPLPLSKEAKRPRAAGESDHVR